MIPSSGRLFREFEKPPREFSPAPIWWWSGEKLDPQRLRWQLERFAEGGVYNLVILNLAPTGPLYGSISDDPHFLSDAWWEIFEGVCRDAQRLGIRLWFYDQIGFSGANFQGRLIAKEPSFAGTTLERDPRSGRIYTVRRGFDYFNPRACAALMDSVHGAFERRAKRWFGTVIAGSFQDELPDMPSWSPDFAAQFKRRFGYDLRPRLKSLWEGEAPADLQVRADYHACRAQLGEEAFFKPLFQWHERHGLQCGCDQQGDARSGNPADGVRIYADYARTHRWFQAPGSDQHGDAKIHSSLAHLYGRPRTWIEAFHSSGWGGTLEETFDWLLPWIRAGANLYNPHAAYYSTKGGNWEWAPPSTCWRQPYWVHYKGFADAVARLGRLLTQGSHVADTAVLFPNLSCQAGATLQGPGPLAKAARDDYKAVTGQMFFNQPVAGALDRDGRDFDVLDEESLAKASFSSGALHVAGESYKILILPSCSVLPEEGLAALRRFTAAGGRLVTVGRKPAWVKGKSGLKRCGALKALHAADAEALLPILARLPRQVRSPVPTLRRRAEGAEILLVPAVHPRATRRLEQGGWDPFQYAFNPRDYASAMKVGVQGVKGAPELWDPFSGARKKLSAKPIPGGVEVEVPFSQGPAALLVWPSEPSARSRPENSPAVLETLDGPWDGRLIPTLDNRYGDFDLPAKDGMIPLETWRFLHRREGQGEDGLALGWQLPGAAASGWSPAKAGLGSFGWQSQVGAPGWLPRLLETSASQRPLDPSGLLPSEYSLSRGFPKERYNHGPKGCVPEEFLDFGQAKAGQQALFRTSLRGPSGRKLILAVGSRAAKEAWLNGVRLEAAESGGYIEYFPAYLRAGDNQLEFRLSARENGELRAYWALLRSSAEFKRPEWIMAQGAPAKDALLRFRLDLNLSSLPSGGTLQLATDSAMARLLVNGKELGRQGGFEPYGSHLRVTPYPASNFRKGANRVEVEMLDPGNRPCPMFLDGFVTLGGRRRELVSGTHWKAGRRGEAAGAAQRHWGYAQKDPAWFMLRPRPHPLPKAVWLDGRPQGRSVIEVVPNAWPGEARVEWLRWILPPGATALQLPLKAKARLWVDGKELALRKGRAKLPQPGALRREAALRVEPKDGRNGGALLDGPITYEAGPGKLALGDWRELGLASYSGGLCYSRRLRLPSGRGLTLDLGRVRGTASVRLNGKELGSRFVSPYTFSLGGAAKPGMNLLEISVYNTLAPYLGAASSTPFVLPGQDVSGLFGPVRILRS